MAHGVFVIWEPPSPSFFKVNFNGSVGDRRGGVDFIINDHASRLVTIGGSHLFDLSIPSYGALNYVGRDYLCMLDSPCQLFIHQV